jgi:hypothetical protein
VGVGSTTMGVSSSSSKERSGLMFGVECELWLEVGFACEEEEVVWSVGLGWTRIIDDRLGVSGIGIGDDDDGAFALENLEEDEDGEATSGELALPRLVVLPLLPVVSERARSRFFCRNLGNLLP